MKNRRLFLKSIAPLAASLAIPKIAEASPDLCQFHADGLASAMKEKHGGSWEIMFDKKTKYVLVSRSTLL